MYVPTLFVRERYGKSKKLLSLSIHRQMILKISLLQIYENSPFICQEKATIARFVRKIHPVPDLQSVRS